MQMTLQQQLKPLADALNKKKDNVQVELDQEMKTVAIDSFGFAKSYLSTLEHSLGRSSRFNNDLLYNIAVMAMEKLFVALLARYDWNATHHMPVALYKEALQFETEMTDNMKATSILVGKFEAICSLDGFGYKTPTNDELHSMMTGMKEIELLVEKRIEEIQS